jgi:hypothetical protein
VIVFIQRNGDDDARFEASAGTPDAHAAFLHRASNARLN